MHKTGKLRWIWAVSVLTALAASLASAETKRVETRTRFVKLTSKAPEGSIVRWDVRDPVDTEYYTFDCRDGTSAVVVWVKSPRAELRFDAINWDARTWTTDTWIVDYIGTDPGPGPGPDPDPDPPGDAPFPAPGLTVMIIVESQDLSSLPPNQLAILSSSEMLQYVKAKCYQIGAGDFAFRRWDDDLTDAQLNNTAPFLKTAYLTIRQKTQQAVPSLGISNGKDGYVGPLPNNIPAMMQLLRKYGG